MQRIPTVEPPLGSTAITLAHRERLLSVGRRSAHRLDKVRPDTARVVDLQMLTIGLFDRFCAYNSGLLAATWGGHECPHRRPRIWSANNHHVVLVQSAHHHILVAARIAHHRWWSAAHGGGKLYVSVGFVQPPNESLMAASPFAGAQGTSFGLTSTVTINPGSRDCPVINGGRSHTSIVCTLPSGRGSATATVTVLGRNSTAFGFTYALPT